MTVILTSCGGKSMNIIPVGEEATDTTITNEVPRDMTSPEIIEERVRTIYKAVAAAYPEINDISPSNDSLDFAFCTGQWQTLVEMVNEKDASNMGRSGFFKADYWIMGQDWGRISASNIKANVKNDTHADVTLTLHNLSDIRVKLEMIFERGEWLIDNFIDQSHNKNWKQSMIKYLEKKEKEDKDLEPGIIEYDY